METEVCAGVIIYRRTRSGIKFLLLYHGGRYWNFPKGHATEGEKSFAAAIREVREETGLGQSDMRFLDWFRVQDEKPQGGFKGCELLFGGNGKSTRKNIKRAPRVRMVSMSGCFTFSNTPKPPYES